MHIRIYYYTPNEPGGFTQPYGGVAANIWGAMSASSCPDAHYVDFGWREWRAGHEEITTTGVAVGGIVIWDWERGAALVKLKPDETSQQKIKAALDMLCGVEFTEESGYVTTEDGLPFGTGSGVPDDDCFFQDIWFIGDRLAFLCDLEKYIMLGLSGFFTFKAIDTNNDNARAAWGTAAAFTGIKAATDFKLLK